ncbi:MAG: PilZ domain-containing protein [Nannocystaceae bacterium]|nr:PilZ domain-containing protein [bacterium]
MTDDPTNKNRRRAPRVPLSVGLAEADPRTTTPVSDLSQTGVFVHTDEQLPLGSVIDLRFTVFPEEPVLFEGKGTVVRHCDDPKGMGVEFLDLSHGAREVLREIQIRHEAKRAANTLTRSHPFLRTHGLVAKLAGDA